MIYCKWRLSEGMWGEGPESVVAERGGRLEAGAYVDAAGYRVGYLTESADLSSLTDYDFSEVTEAEALTFCQQFYIEAVVLRGGMISTPPIPEEAR
jgi:hypothetical protein